ncbi:MAG TPA: cyclopropane fatty acyl phospholipid synthase, partial [Gammaproteobacteria bacterium]|nr:cyclopropane fatty acyl phospholipid synthase [Gammaproteobacteria bacterium]
MAIKSAQFIVEDLLQRANIAINGERPEDIRVHNEQLYPTVVKTGALGFGEAYVDRWWDCERLDILFENISRAQLYNRINQDWRRWLKVALARFHNPQSKRKAPEVAKKHYDLGNNLFQAMLDPRMNYSCGYWHQAKTLEEAQHAKLKLICKKLKLSPGMKLLDIGCGFGGLAKYAALHHDVHVIGINLSKEQVRYAQEYCLGLPIEIRLQDYRNFNETVDRIVSVGMFEHVGFQNYRHFMQVAHRCLKPDGLFLLHTIGNNLTYYAVDEWISTYIFPNGMLPSISLIGKAIEDLFIMEDWHNFGADYDKTLMSWQQQF